MQVHMEDREEFVKKTAGVREEPVREVDEKIDMAAKAFKMIHPAGARSIINPLLPGLSTP